MDQSPQMAIQSQESTGTLLCPSNSGRLNFRELWDYRELLYFLAWRDIQVRYKQTVLGVAWAILQPLLTMTTYSLVFGRLVGISSNGIPYPLWVYTALLPWQFFSHALAKSSNSLVENQSLITKVYFPRLVIPIAAVLAGVIDFALAFIVLLGMLLYYGQFPSNAFLAVIPFVLLTLIATWAIGFWLSALNVEYRDVRHIIPFLTQLWFFVTPIVYPSSLIPEPWRMWSGLNPLAGIVEGFRWALLTGNTELDPIIWVSMCTTLFLFVTGLGYFRRVEKNFADVV